MTGVLVLVAVTVGATANGHGRMDRRRDALVFRFETEAADAVLTVIDRDRPVHLVTDGLAAFLSVGPALVVALEDAGVDVRLDETQSAEIDDAQRAGYGPHRLELADDPGARVHVVSGEGELPDVPGQVVARLSLNDEADRLADRLTEQLAAGPLIASDRADDLLAPHEGSARDAIKGLLAQLVTDPGAAFRNAIVLDLLRQGYLASPALDGDLLDAMRAALGRDVYVWGDDRFAIGVELLP